MRKLWDGSIHLSGMRARQNLHPLRQTAKVTVLALGVCLFALGPTCHAQSETPGNDAPVAVQETHPTAPPAAGQSAVSTPANVRVVRLSDVEGAVQLLRGNETQFSQAVMNMPLTEGSRINTGADGRAEIEFEDGSVARITPNSSLSITQLQAGADGTLDTTVEQLSGLIYYELRSDPKTPFKVMVGGRSVTPTVNSTFRINLGAAPPELAVIDGGVQVQGASNGYQADVQQGKTIQFQSADSAKYTIADGITPNGFDEWNDQLDQEAAQEAQNQTPARVQQGGGSIMDSGIGWSDLDNAGGWYPLPGYGMVWQPYGVGADFDPYGDGMWADFGGGFGYSWVSGYPWGWLPFHYGMWSYIGGFGWGWMPCAYPYRGFRGGFGGYGYVGRNHPYTNIAGGPAGYRAPVPPAVAQGHRPPRIVRVGNRQGPAMGSNARDARFRGDQKFRGDHLAAGNGHMDRGHGNDALRPIRFNGTKVAPLHSMMAGVRVPTRNAALYNNYPTRAFHGDIRRAMLNRSAGTAHGMGAATLGSGLNRNGMGHGHRESMRSGNFRGENFRGHRGSSADGLRGPMSPSRASASRAARFNAARGQGFSRHSFGGQNRAFGRQSSFGSHGGFGAASRGGFHSGGMERPRGFGGGFHGEGFRGASGMGRAGGFHGGGNMGRVGGASSGGFHGGGASHAGGFRGGGGMGHAGGFSGGGGHAGGMAGGGHAGGFSGGGGHGR